jgi:hypothetical protein
MVRYSTLVKKFGEPRPLNDDDNPSVLAEENRLLCCLDDGLGFIGWRLMGVSNRLVFSVSLDEKYRGMAVSGM